MKGKGGGGSVREWVVSVSAFGELATELPDDLAKGERVYCEGRLTVSRWEKDGELRANLRLAGSRILMLDRIGCRARRRRWKPKPRKPLMLKQQVLPDRKGFLGGDGVCGTCTASRRQ
jgi:single-stranded DNA-binding protein